ncbi:unnamed protein product [Polarella glacialis]|uniref:Dynein heavy chain ATP-binding dynein motor region domain-containing protein n=1 Tax=Polarella glacialis TaxID=89957 RepID=A0A813HD26_POLGL|nr:unnamed protein product [Polarella glacialis]
MEAQNKMEEIQRRVEAVASEVTALHSKQDRFLQEVSANETRIGRVENLLANLGDQRADWAEKVGKLRGLSQLLPGDALFCALMCAHGGPLNQANRSAISERAVLCMQGGRLDFSQGSLSLAKILGSRAKLTDWHLAGLPQDPQVVENMLIMDSASTLLWPFMVDPHTQGVRFVKEMSRGAFGRDRQKENPMKIVRESDPGLLQVVTATLELGGWLLIEEVGSRLDVALLPLLERRTEETDDGECCVRLGGSLVTWNPSFRLLLATSSPTMDLLPELAVHVTPLNFSVTLKGIEEQMLSLVISYENPDLEKRKAEVIGLRATYFRELEGAENKVLQILNDSGAAIFDDEQMISSILTTRLTWTAAEERAADVKRIEVDLDSVSISFATLAHHVSSLVNVVLSLDRMSNFYQFSLEWVKMILRPALEETRRGQSQEEQLQNAGEHCARHLYRAIAPSLCEQHRIVFGLHLALAQMLSLGRAEECDVGFLLNFGSAALPSGSLTRMKTSVVLEAALATLPPSDVAIFLALIQLPAFTGLTTAFVSAESEWKAWRSESIRPDKQKLPGNWESRIMPLQRLCLLAVLRPDGLPRAAAELVARELGCDRGQPPSVAGLDELLGQWPALAPVLFVLHEDCPDPVVELRQTAARFGIQRGLEVAGNNNNIQRGLEAVALASNQGPRAKRVLEEAKAKGGWAMISAPRLFLSTRPVDTFPAGLTRGSLKQGTAQVELYSFKPSLLVAAAGDKAEDQAVNVLADRWTLAFVGHWDYRDRSHYDAAASVGKMYSNITGLSLGVGATLGLATFCSQAHGAGLSKAATGELNGLYFRRYWSCVQLVGVPFYWALNCTKLTHPGLLMNIVSSEDLELLAPLF